MSEKILELGPKQWLSGITPNLYDQEAPLLQIKTNGVSAILDDSTDRAIGSLKASPQPQQKGGSSSVPDTIMTGISEYSSTDTTVYEYSLGDNGNFYERDAASYLNDVKKLRSSNNTLISNPASGMAVYQPRGGTRYLYYFQKTQVGRWDLSGSYPTGWTDNWQTGLNSTVVHPTHEFLDSVYFGNDNEIGEISDDGNGGETFQTNVLDVPSRYQVRSLSDDGRYLIAALVPSGATGDNGNFVGSKIIFWDTNSNSWNREWDIDESTGIYSIRTVGGVTYALDHDGLWALSFESRPQKIVQFPASAWTSIDIGPEKGLAAKYSDGVMTPLSNGVAWISNKGGITFYGQRYPGLPKAIHAPVSSISGSKVFIGTGPNQIVTGGTNDYYVMTGALSTRDTGSEIKAETRYIDLGAHYQITKAEVIFGKALSSGDELDVDVDAIISSEGFDENISYSTHGAVTKHTIRSTGSLEANFVKLQIEFIGGAPIVAKVRLYGDRLDNETPLS